MTELKALYDSYYEKATAVRRKASLFDGFWGFGRDPAKDACHEDFYESVAEWVSNFNETDPDRILEVVKFMFAAPLEHCGEDVFGYLFAAHGLLIPLFSKLRREDCAELALWYDKKYPRSQRLPLQQKVWKTLKELSK